MFHTLFLCISVQKPILCIKSHPFIWQKGWPSKTLVKPFYLFTKENTNNMFCKNKLHILLFYFFITCNIGMLSTNLHINFFSADRNIFNFAQEHLLKTVISFPCTGLFFPFWVKKNSTPRRRNDSIVLSASEIAECTRLNKTKQTLSKIAVKCWVVINWHRIIL